MTVQQILESLLAIPAFLPATFCTGYLVAWSADLQGFRRRSLVERVFWSIPLSIGISPICAVLIGKALSLAAVVVFFAAAVVLWFAIVLREIAGLRASGQRLHIGWKPFGNAALVLATLWSGVAILSLVDLQSGHSLFASLTIYDHGMRVNWIQSALHTGVPPKNSLYMYRHTAPMRYYYFWYVLCAATARMWYLPARGVLIASCVWAGFALAALAGLYIKHFLDAGIRVRQQFLRATGLLAVAGLDICVHVWEFFYLHRSLPGDLQVWTAGQITSWFNSLLWVPHHVASMLCCMFGFLLVWMEIGESRRNPTLTIALTALAFASAFGLSIYVAFAFLLAMLAWAAWQAVFAHNFRAGFILFSAGAGAVLLLFPYLWDLTHNSSNLSGLGGASAFAFSVREMIPPDWLLSKGFFQHMAASHPVSARILAKLTLLAPGYGVELGFYGAAFLIYLLPATRGGKHLTAAQRSLVFIICVTFVVISFLPSSVISVNDFGLRAALLLQFPLLLLGSELLTSWKLADRGEFSSATSTGLPGRTPYWVRSIASFALIFGVLTTAYQAILVRSMLFVLEKQLRLTHDPRAGQHAHNAYISEVGYAQLDAAVPQNSIVQYKPWGPDSFWLASDWLGAAHQSAIAGDQGACGAEFGGDPRGCLPMAAAIDALYNDATAEQARATCGQIGIQYLIAKVYDPPWNDKNSWVWTLPAVVADPEFRALDCR